MMLTEDQRKRGVESESILWPKVNGVAKIPYTIAESQFSIF